MTYYKDPKVEKNLKDLSLDAAEVAVLSSSG
jgi:hypothetical protein